MTSPLSASLWDRMANLLPVLALACAVSLPLGSLPVFALGYWDKAEPLVVWFHGTAALAALAVAYALWRRPQPTLARILHPFVLLPLAVGGWSILVAPATDLPLLSVMGAPQSGFGALWFLDLTAFTAGALLVAEQPAAWRLLVRLVIGVVTAVAALKAWDWHSLRRDGGHLLIFVAAYYGWLALALPLVVEPGRRFALAIALGAAAAVAVASQSMTAIVLLAVGTALVTSARMRPRLVAMLTLRRAAIAVMIAAALPWLLLHGLPWLLEKESLRDRVLIHGLVQADLTTDPVAFVFGHGWGRTQDAFHTWLNLSGERLWDPTWIFLTSDYFHSHNWALEALHATGIPGMLLLLAGFVAIPLFARPECRPQAVAFAVATALFQGLWFQLSLSIPLTAMALAAMADRTVAVPRLPSRVVVAAAVLIGAAQFAAATALLSYGSAIGAVKAAWSSVPPRAVTLPADFRGGDLAAAELIRDTLNDFARRARTEPTAPLADAIRPMLAFIDARAAGTPAILLLTTGLGAMAQIHVTGELAFVVTPEYMAMWRRWLDRLLAKAPGRTDQAIPYFTACITQNRMGEVADLSFRLLATQPDDPVALYYRGLVTVTEADPARKVEGLVMIRRAIENGLGRFMPVDPNLKTLLRLP